MRAASFRQLAGAKADRVQLWPTCWDDWKDVLIGSIGDPFHSDTNLADAASRARPRGLC